MSSAIEAEFEIERVEYDVASQEGSFDRWSVGEYDATLGYGMGLPVILQHAPGSDGLCELMRPSNLCQPSDFQALTGGDASAAAPPASPAATAPAALGNARLRICQPFAWGSKMMDGRYATAIGPPCAARQCWQPELICPTR